MIIGKDFDIRFCQQTFSAEKLTLHNLQLVIIEQGWAFFQWPF